VLMCFLFMYSSTLFGISASATRKLSGELDWNWSLIIDLDICEGMGELCLFYALLAAFLNFSDNCWYLIVKEVQQVTESWIILAQRSNHRMNKSSSGSSIYHSKTVSNNRMLCLVVYSLVKLSASNIIVCP
jgi:hypothetical protein